MDNLDNTDQNLISTQQNLPVLQIKKKWWNHWYINVLFGLLIAIFASLTYYLFINRPSKNNNSTVSVVTKTNESPVIVNDTKTLKSGPDLTKLPLGDSKLSTEPKQGYIYSCQAQAGGGGGGGAKPKGNWLGTDTWDLTKKPHVSGDVAWPTAKIDINLNGNTRTITSNDLPTIHNTGIFPIGKSDPASAYDKNPNTIKTQTYNYKIALNPSLNSKGSCLPPGPIGIMLDGVIFFNGFDAENQDAVAHEIQDSCGGHPEQSGSYHYHGISTCIPNATTNKLIGYSFDGFGIYGNKDSDGNTLSTTELDSCHGTTSNVEWEGKTVNMYHYVITNDFPYTMGCYMGTSTATKNTQNR